MTFGQTIKSLRREANMTQENLTELLSISPQAVSRWETDVAMPDNTCARYENPAPAVPGEKPLSLRHTKKSTP